MWLGGGIERGRFVFALAGGDVWVAVERKVTLAQQDGQSYGKLVPLSPPILCAQVHACLFFQNDRSTCPSVYLISVSLTLSLYSVLSLSRSLLSLSAELDVEREARGAIDWTFAFACLCVAEH